MKYTVIIITIFLCCLAPQDLGAQDEPLVDVALNRLIEKAQREAQRDVIRVAARPMFNNVNDWQRWENQLNAMQPQQLNGLMNILNAAQRQILAQRQQWLSQLLQRQWLEQQLGQQGVRQRQLGIRLWLWERSGSYLRRSRGITTQMEFQRSWRWFTTMVKRINIMAL